MLHLLWIVRWRGVLSDFRGDSAPMPFCKALKLASNPKNSRKIAHYWIEPAPPQPKETTMHEAPQAPPQPFDWTALMNDLMNPTGVRKISCAHVYDHPSRAYDESARKLRDERVQRDLKRFRDGGRKRGRNA